MESRSFVFIDIPALFVNFLRILFLFLLYVRTYCPSKTGEFSRLFAPLGYFREWVEGGAGLQPSVPSRPWPPPSLQLSTIAYILAVVKRQDVRFGLGWEVGCPKEVRSPLASQECFRSELSCAQYNLKLGLRIA